MTKRLFLFGLCLTIVLTACASRHYIRKSEPRTIGDSLARRADSLRWAEAIRAGSSCIWGNPDPRIEPPKH